MIDIQFIIDKYGEWSLNYAGEFVRWIDIGIWSAMEDMAQTFVGL